MSGAQPRDTAAQDDDFGMHGSRYRHFARCLARRQLSGIPTIRQRPLLALF
jgi:hypothetical protein